MKKEKILSWLKENWSKLTIVILAILFLYFTQIEPRLAMKKKCLFLDSLRHGTYEGCLIMGVDFFK